MQTNLKFEGASQDFRLTHAILIYGNAAETHAATIHDVDLEGGQGAAQPRPVIKPGSPVTILAIERLLLGLGRHAGGGFLPENVLSVAMDRLAWWCPANRRRIWFKASHEKSAVINWVNGKFVWHPPLVFTVKNGGLNVFALLENQRPNPATKLFRAPYWNLNGGHMCRGDIKYPACSPENIPGFEKAFFESAFTHTSAGAITKHADGHNGLWQELAKHKTRPDAKYWKHQLLPSDQIITNLLK